MAILPVSNIIDVTITNTPQGLSPRNVNSLALFTTETPDNLDPYGIYISASQVAEAYGTDSVTAAMASNIFAQAPNIRSGDGRLVVIPYTDAVSATAGNVVTPSLASTLADILLVTNGDLKVTIDSVAYNLTGLNFTQATDLEDVAAILQARLINCVVTSTTTTLTFTSKKVGADSTVTIGAVSGGTGTDLSGNGYFKAGTSTSTDGDDAEGETLLEAITRTKGLVGYAGIITNLSMEDDLIEATATGIQAQDYIFVYAGASTQDIAGVATTIKAAGQTKTRFLLYTPGIAEANLMAAAYAGRAFSTNFAGSNTSSTMNLKGLVNVTPDDGITQTLYAAADVAGVDIYVSYEGVGGVYATFGNNFFDNVYADLALKFQLEAAGFNFLRQTNTKVPQTETGMNGLKSAYAQIMVRFVRNGSFAPGSWTSSETFGNPDIFRQNILNIGYYIYSLPIVEQSAEDRELRKAPLVQIAAKRAGAIQTSTVIVNIND